jgi:nucleoside-diphosphate-sugar epimerase
MQGYLASIAKPTQQRKDVHMTEKHIVLGAGQIGTALAAKLASLGHDVVSVRRTATASSKPGIRNVAGNIADLTFARELGQGADVIYHVLNPAYHRWPQELPPLTDGVLAAVQSSGARLVMLDNLYMHGQMNGVAMNERSPESPCSKKGELRKRMADRYRAEQAAGKLHVAFARSSDFVGPNIVQAALSTRFFDAVLQGKPGDLLGDPALPHALTYIDDVVDTLATLGTDPRGMDKTWIVPTLPAMPIATWIAAFESALAIKIRTRVMPPWLMTVLGPFVPIMRELKEMNYQWTTPYLVDDSSYRTTFGVAPVPFEQQVKATAAWAKQRAPKA